MPLATQSIATRISNYKLIIVDKLNIHKVAEKVKFIEALESPPVLNSLKRLREKSF